MFYQMFTNHQSPCDLKLQTTYDFSTTYVPLITDTKLFTKIICRQNILYCKLIFIRVDRN